MCSANIPAPQAPPKPAMTLDQLREGRNLRPNGAEKTGKSRLRIDQTMTGTPSGLGLPPTG